MVRCRGELADAFPAHGDVDPDIIIRRLAGYARGRLGPWRGGVLPIPLSIAMGYLGIGPRAA
eukprot:11485617-Alexandrium_andersonii.AAC.1